MSAGKTQRLRALMFECPACLAPIGYACRRDDGRLRSAMHRERARKREPSELRAASAAFSKSGRGAAVLFFSSDEWRSVRYEALRRSNGRCQCCGAGPSEGKPLHVDHIKPRSRFPDLALTLSNLQVLCQDCNLGKGARDQTDWRRP